MKFTINVFFVITSLMSLGFTTNQVLADGISSTAPNSTDITEVPKKHIASSSTLIIHKPSPDPAWGKVIQYEVEQNPTAHETLYKFLFQDSKGLIRTAAYHEGSSETGYWEVWVWDLP